VPSLEFYRGGILGRNWKSPPPADPPPPSIVFIVLSLIALYLYTNTVHIFPIETIIRNAGKPNRKPYDPHGFSHLYEKSVNEEKSSLLMKSIL
jgi:hypothetical protein